MLLVSLPAASAPAPPPLSATPLSAGAIYAGADVDVHFYLAARGGGGSIFRLVPLEKTRVTAEITMPSMPGMPPMMPTVHEEGAPGYFGVTTLFPHGGEYRVALTADAGGGAFRLNVMDAPDGPLPPPPFVVIVEPTPDPPAAGLPVTMRLGLTRRVTGEPVTDLLIVHTKPWHLLVMSDDLRWFDHIHPVAGPDGRYTVTETFPFGGRFLLLSDVSPKGAGQQFAPAELTVSGAAPAATYALAPTPRSRTIEGVTIALNAPSTLKAHEDVTLAFDVRDAAGAPVTDLEPYLGAMGHLIIVSQDRTRFVHSHPSSLEAAGTGTVRFLCRFPKPGLYKAWAQFQRAGKVITADYVVKVDGS
ncbi:MAG TPA: FixH family protein [Armatimonadota bacterium]